MTPAADDQLAGVLREIAEMERREGFEGPKITGYISSVAAMQDLMVRGGGDFMPKVVDDATVGEIGRACEARSKPGRQKWQYYMKWPKAPEGDYLVIVQAGPLRFEGRGGSLALAVATAYRDALKHSTESVKSS